MEGVQTEFLINGVTSSYLFGNDSPHDSTSSDILSQLLNQDSTQRNSKVRLFLPADQHHRRRSGGKLHQQLCYKSAQRILPLLQQGNQEPPASQQSLFCCAAVFQLLNINVYSFIQRSKARKCKITSVSQTCFLYVFICLNFSFLLLSITVNLQYTCKYTSN